VLETITAVVFILVAAVTMCLGLRTGNTRAEAIARLAPNPVPQPGPPPSGLVWRELVNRIGARFPAPARDLPRLKIRLVRAGFRGPAAPRQFQGARAVSTALMLAAGLFFSLRSQAPLDKVIIATAAAALFGYMAPEQFLKFRIARRKHAIEKGLPNALDLMVVCVESGLGIDQTMLQVAKELQFAHPEICDEFTLMNLELRAGKRRHEALHNLADRAGVEDLKKLVAVLVQTDRFGTSIAQSLRGHADYLRTLARQRAEERASKLAVKLVFPIFFCILPSLFVVTIGPVNTRLVRDLLPMIENL
jgi:tight adherence protein C